MGREEIRIGSGTKSTRVSGTWVVPKGRIGVKGVQKNAFDMIGRQIVGETVYKKGWCNICRRVTGRKIGILE